MSNKVFPFPSINGNNSVVGLAKLFKTIASSHSRRKSESIESRRASISVQDEFFGGVRTSATRELAFGNATLKTREKIDFRRFVKRLWKDRCIQRILFVLIIFALASAVFVLRFKEHRLDEEMRRKWLKGNGLAEPIRLTLAQANVPFEDIRIPMEEWPEMKKRMPFGQVPVLVTETGFVLTQSAAILRYIGAAHGLQADDPQDRATADELATSWYDLFAHSSGAFAEDDPAKKKEKFLKLIDDFIHPRLRIFDNRLANNKSDFLVGDKATWADFVSYNFISSFQDWMHLNLEAYQHVIKFKKQVEALPRIKQWQEQHINARWSVWPSPFD